MGPALHVDVPTDVGVTGAAAAVLVVTEAAKGSLAPSSCRWCEVDDFDARAREATRWHGGAAATADALSYLSGYALAPVAALAIDGLSASDASALSEVPADALVVLESALVAQSVDQAAKFAFARERPYAHDDRTAAGPRATPGADDNLSFFSGHTTFAFAAAVSAGTVASMRHRRLAPLVWGVGLTLAAATGYLRMAADKHYLTDVMTGAGFGGAMGALVPLVFHGKLPPLAVTAPPGAGAGASVSFSTAF